MFETYTAKKLETEHISPPLMVVQDLLPVGLTVLAGSPKLGKSWLSLLLCCCVAEQRPFLGHETYQGEVLYLDLEGSPYRLQERLSKIGMGFPEYLQVSHTSPRIGQGFMEALEDWWSKANAFPRLVVIDTLARIKGAGKRNLNAYEADSQEFAPLQKFALEKQIAIVAVTHLKKQSNFSGADSDWLERISGSMGLSGVSDNIWGLFRKRGSDTAFLRTSARDVDPGDMVIQFSDGLWTFVSDDLDGYAFQQIPLVRFLKSLDNFNGTAAELCEKYKAFCEAHSLAHGLAEAQPVTSFGKQMKAITKDLWRIRKSCKSDRRSNGTVYHISFF